MRIGLLHQVLAAKRAGVHDVILPAENKTNVEEDLTPEQLENVTIHYVTTIAEVLHIALPSNPVEAKQDAQDREKEVAELFDKYNLLTLPVVDDQMQLTGVITSDDVISMLRAKL